MSCFMEGVSVAECGGEAARVGEARKRLREVLEMLATGCLLEMFYVL